MPLGPVPAFLTTGSTLDLHWVRARQRSVGVASALGKPRNERLDQLTTPQRFAPSSRYAALAHQQPRDAPGNTGRRVGGFSERDGPPHDCLEIDRGSR